MTARKAAITTVSCQEKATIAYKIKRKFAVSEPEIPGIEIVNPLAADANRTIQP
ncbi:hypothetical protein F183_A36110 [Bryobacterales bacterium F-183]|nr:hypothetical protein F183_A36110 [Bryobacterales bacterium F-183]